MFLNTVQYSIYEKQNLMLLERNTVGPRLSVMDYEALLITDIHV